MVKSSEDPGTSEVLLPNSPTKLIQSLQLPAHPPKSYSACANQQKRVRDAGRISSWGGGGGPGGRREFSEAVQHQLRWQLTVLLHHTLGILKAECESHPSLSQVVEAPFQKAQREGKPYQFVFRKQLLS